MRSRRLPFLLHRRWIQSSVLDGFDYRRHRIEKWNSFFAAEPNGERAVDRLLARDRSTAELALGSRVNNTVRNLRDIVSSSDDVRAVLWDELEGKLLLWHSTAHLLGDAIEQHFGRVLLLDGPALSPSPSRSGVQEGFFYEFWAPQAVVAQKDFAELEGKMLTLAKQKRRFETLKLSVDQAREMFSYNPFKLEVIERVAKDPAAVLTVYRCGDFIDLCRGPHIPNTGRVRWVRLTNASAAVTKDPQQQQDVSVHRVYGISFPSQEQGQAWEHAKTEAERRDHRVLGQKQNLLMFHDLSPGSAFFLPDGTYIFNRLTQLMRKHYWERGFQEVITPILYNKKLWQTSGHWDNYKDDMFFLERQKHEHSKEENCGHNHEEDVIGLKPMNCPGHCLIFGHSKRSYRELPLRLADFGVLHRNEQSGSLSGLTRVRKFQQDDAHIFCQEEALDAELRGCLDFLKAVYEKLGFGSDFHLRLATRPAKYVGDLDLWNRAEDTLRATLSSFNRPWTVAEGDGAFYGPKVDVLVRDAMQRAHQCGTIQLDFQLPRKFQLTYVAEDGTEKTPVMIHRAILGSFERMFAVLTEHCAGKWPAWLNPRCVAVIPIADTHKPHAAAFAKKLHGEGIRAFVLDDDNTLQKRVRTAQLQHYNYMIVIGDAEVSGNDLSVRTREGGNETTTMTVAAFISKVKKEIEV